MRILTRAAWFLAGLVVLFVAAGFLLPESVRMERSIVIDAPAADIFAKVDDLRAFREWAPWYERDPDASYRYEGPETGVGATVHWRSDHPEVGSGSQRIVESRRDAYVRYALDFGARGDAESWFDLEPAGGGTRVTWGFATEFGYDLIGRYFGLILESMLAPDYEAGLEKLRRIVEAGG